MSELEEEPSHVTADETVSIQFEELSEESASTWEFNVSSYQNA